MVILDVFVLFNKIKNAAIIRNLNLDDKEDYATGMKTFKEDTMANLGYYLTEQKKAGLYVKYLAFILWNFFTSNPN